MSADILYTSTYRHTRSYIHPWTNSPLGRITGSELALQFLTTAVCDSHCAQAHGPLGVPDAVSALAPSSFWVDDGTAPLFLTALARNP